MKLPWIVYNYVLIESSNIELIIVKFEKEIKSVLL
jgi:hypothetical protein